MSLPFCSVAPIAPERFGRGNETILKERCFCLESQGLTSALDTDSLHKRQLVGRSEAATAWLSPGAGREAPSVPPAVPALHGERPAASPGAAAAASPPGSTALAPAFSGAAAAMEMNIYIPWKSAVATAEGPGGGWSRSSLPFPNANEPVPRLLAQVCSAFVSLDYQLGSGRRSGASR